MHYVLTVKAKHFKVMHSYFAQTHIWGAITGTHKLKIKLKIRILYMFYWQWEENLVSVI